jgi:hypothetical protein
LPRARTADRIGAGETVKGFAEDCDRSREEIEQAVLDPRAARFVAISPTAISESHFGASSLMLDLPLNGTVTCFCPKAGTTGRPG